MIDVKDIKFSFTGEDAGIISRIEGIGFKEWTDPAKSAQVRMWVLQTAVGVAYCCRREGYRDPENVWWDVSISKESGQLSVLDNVDFTFANVVLRVLFGKEFK